MRKPIHPHPLVHADRLLARGVFCLLFALYALTAVGLPDNPDAEVEFQTTRSLARFEGLAISTETSEGAAIVAARFDVAEGRDGRFYSWFGVGQALVAVPLYWIGAGLGELLPELESAHRASGVHQGIERTEYVAHLAVGLRNPLAGALTGFFLTAALLRLGIRRRAAVGCALAYGLSTFVWPLARASLSDVQATCLLFGAFHFVLRVRESFLRFESPRRLDLIGAGFCLGLAAATRIVLGPAVVALALATVAVVARGRRRLWSSPLLKVRAGALGAIADLAWFAIPAAGWLAVFVGTNLLRFGAPLETGYGAAVFSGTFFSYPPWLGLLGVTVAPGKGLFWLAPLVLVAPLGFWLSRSDRLVWSVAIVLTACVFTPIVMTQTFHGAWTFGPRYILPALPFLWIGVGQFVSTLGPTARLRRWLVRGLIGFGVVANLGAVLVDQSTYHDLALQAGRLEWPDLELESASQADDMRFINIQWDPAFAAPWAMWRILRHRVAHLDRPGAELFPSDEIFGTEERWPLSPTHARDTGFRHLAWVDLEQRLGGWSWPVTLLLAMFLGAGLFLSASGLDPTRP